MAAPMMWKDFWKCLIFLPFLALLTKADADYEGSSTFTLEHTLQSGEDAVWSKRGSVHVRSLKPGKTHLSQSTGPDDELISQLMDASQNNGVYRIRLQVKAQTNGSPDTNVQYVSSFTLACAMYESRLSDYITINLDQSGEAIGVSIVTYPGICTGRTVKDSELLRYNTTVEIAQAVSGPIPDTQTYVEKIKREETERAKGEQPDNRSFFAKYWMYIVPGVIIMLLMNSMDPQAGGAGGGGR